MMQRIEKNRGWILSKCSLTWITIIDGDNECLHGKLTEEIYMNILEEFNEDQDHCLQLMVDC
jgi:hypothetical protein